MQKIVPHLWFDTQAKEAARFYVDAFGDGSRILFESTLHDTPSGSVDTVALEILGHEFAFISAGPLFAINPSISFHVACPTPGDVDRVWERLVDGGTALMPLGSYPFSERYGWVKDRYGVSWQVIHTPEPRAHRITPALMYTEAAAGKAEEAATRYASVFGGTAEVLSRYGSGEGHDAEGTVKYGQFTAFGQTFGVMDSAYPHGFSFNEAVSLMVRCDSQEEIDRYWSALSAVREAEQCGWLKDAFGVSWQVVPTRMDEMLREGTPGQVARVTGAFLAMKKFDLAALERAYAGT